MTVFSDNVFIRQNDLYTAMNTNFLLYTYYLLGCLAFDRINNQRSSGTNSVLAQRISRSEQKVQSLYRTGLIGEDLYHDNMRKLAKARIMSRL